jgi:NTP pyrophosphatase (non-canonical NTP hydrolase)
VLVRHSAGNPDEQTQEEINQEDCEERRGVMGKLLEWNDYQSKARAFSSYADGTGKERSYDHIHCAALGLAGESAEAVEYISATILAPMPQDDLLKIRGELGDVLWYIAELSAAFEISMETLYLVAATLPPADGAKSPGKCVRLYTDLTIWAGKSVDYIKKVAHHKHQIDVSKLADMLAKTLHAVIGLTYFFSFTMEIVAEANLEKLRLRYPEGQFTTARSINRAPE